MAKANVGKHIRPIRNEAGKDGGTALTCERKFTFLISYMPTHGTFNWGLGCLSTLFCSKKKTIIRIIRSRFDHIGFANFKNL